ncbi:hypothetical protein V8C26DRAFT_203840 [Trichoderma gracile]
MYYGQGGLREATLCLFYFTGETGQPFSYDFSLYNTRSGRGRACQVHLWTRVLFSQRDWALTTIFPTCFVFLACFYCFFLLLPSGSGKLFWRSRGFKGRDGRYYGTLSRLKNLLDTICLRLCCFCFVSFLFLWPALFGAVRAALASTLGR